jgi:hypothetical protein
MSAGLLDNNAVVSLALYLRHLYVGHNHIDVLKMDIEGAEWAFVMKEASLLTKVGQLTCM